MSPMLERLNPRLTAPGLLLALLLLIVVGHVLVDAHCLTAPLRGTTLCRGVQEEDSSRPPTSLPCSACHVLVFVPARLAPLPLTALPWRLIRAPLLALVPDLAPPFLPPR